MLVGRRRGEHVLACSLDLDRSETQIELGTNEWRWHEGSYPYLERCRERTIYHWTGAAFEPVARFGTSLLKLVPTEWGPPTFEIDGVKMLPTKQVSPYDDARRKVALIEPGGKRVLDTCAGLGYFAAWCLEGGASEVTSYEINPDVLWLRTLNPWSPANGPGLKVLQVTSARRSADSRTFHSMPSCTIRRALAWPASCIRRPSTTSWRGS